MLNIIEDTVRFPEALEKGRTITKRIKPTPIVFIKQPVL